MDDLSQYKELYLSEMEENLQAISDNLLKLEKQENDSGTSKEERNATLNDLMRASHTIKGSSSSMSYEKTAYLTHILEDVFDYARNNLLEIDSSMIDLLFNCLDDLRDSFESIKETSQETDLDEISKILKSKTGVKTSGTGKSVRSEDGKPVLDVNQEVTEIEEKIPEEIKTPEREVSDGIKEISSIKVPVSRLDDLMNVVGELLIARMQLELIVKDIYIEGEDRKLDDVAKQISKLVSDVQYYAMATRLVHLEQIFSPFPRMIRDLGRKYDKKIDFVVEGGETELDRSVIDRLGEPLVHLLRNAVDHGIDKEGSIKLSAVRDKNMIKIFVEDDGLGINYSAIGDAAVKRGILKPEEVQALSKDQLTELLFNPKLSTNKVVTETSGRGVGLSVVKNFIKELNGNILVESPISSEGGTRFTMQLPQSLAVINALIVKVGDSRFAVPFDDVIRSIPMRSVEIEKVIDREAIIVDGEDISIVCLKEALGLEGEDTDRKEGVVLLVDSGRDNFGLVVDSLIGKEEITVKPLSGSLKKTIGFSGVTSLGDGKSILILEPSSLIESVFVNK